jgi:hypothetical protein
MGLGFGFGQRGKKHGRQDRNDGNDDQQFNQSEASSPAIRAGMTRDTLELARRKLSLACAHGYG